MNYRKDQNITLKRWTLNFYFSSSEFDLIEQIEQSRTQSYRVNLKGCDFSDDLKLFKTSELEVGVSAFADPRR